MDKIAFLQALILDGDKRLAGFEKDKSYLKHCQLLSGGPVLPLLISRR
jgi:hypothetical protein